MFLLYTMYLFAETWYFFLCFKHNCNCSLRNFYGGRFKILIKHFQHLCYFSVGVSWLSVLIEVEILLVFGVASGFLLYPRHFAYYVMRWHGASKVPTSLWVEEVGAEVHVPCLVSIDTLGRMGTLLLLMFKISNGLPLIPSLLGVLRVSY